MNIFSVSWNKFNMARFETMSQVLVYMIFRAYQCTDDFVVSRFSTLDGSRIFTFFKIPVSCIYKVGHTSLSVNLYEDGCLALTSDLEMMSAAIRLNITLDGKSNCTFLRAVRIHCCSLQWMRSLDSNIYSLGSLIIYCFHTTTDDWSGGSGIVVWCIIF